MSMFRRRFLIYQALMNKSGNIVYPGLIAAWSAAGKTNDDKDRAILKDLTGNGHDITLNGFAFSEMSGYGGYKITNFYIHDSLTINSYGYKKINFSLILDSSVNYKSLITIFVSSPNSIMPSFKLKISGLKENQYIGVGFHNYGSNIAHGLGNGIHNISSWTNNTTITSNIYINDNTSPRQHRIYDNVTIELLPEYPDALVFDGIDDYGINEDMPIINDYTLIVKRQWVKPLDTERVLISNGDAVTGLYATELRRANNFGTIINFGNSINVSDSYEKSGYYYNYDIIYQNANTYNGEIKLSKGSNNTSLKYFMIGRFRPSEYNRYFKGAFYSAYLFNRSLDEQEIKAFIRKYIDPEYLLPSEILTPDCYYDFSKGSNDDETRDTIKDYSGNGNDAVAHNFAWRG